MKGRCVWTGQIEEDVIEVQVIIPNRWGGNPHPVSFLVSPEHEASFRRHAAQTTRYAGVYLFLVTIASVGALSFTFIVVDYRGVAACLAAIGVLLIVFPFSAPETRYVMGLRTARRVARVCGVVILAASVAIFLIAP